MTAQTKAENEATLNQLVIKIKTEHRRCIEGIKGVIDHARCIGDWLNEARKLVEHGFWIAWVRTNCKFTSRMAQKYRLVARHYDALVARFNTPDEWTLTEFFAEATVLESEAKKARAAEQGTGGGARKAQADAFHLEKRERLKKVKEIEKRKQKGPLPVEASEPVQNFLKQQRERLLEAIRRFACTKNVKEVAGDLDPAHLGILLVERLKAQLDADGLFSQPAEADATDASKPPEPANRIGHPNGRKKKAVA
jgi:hypothetical protein